MPAASAIMGDSEGLGLIGHRARPAEADPSDLGDTDVTPSAVQAADIPDAVNRSASLAGNPESLILARLTPSGSAVSAVEELPPRLIEITEGLLLYDR